MRFWLRGGWAVDFLLGEVTRPHADIDLVTWVRHRRRIHRALMEAGLTSVSETDVQSDFRADGEDLSIIFLTRARDDRVVTHGIPAWTWPAHALSRQRLSLEGLSAYVANPQQLLWLEFGQSATRGGAAWPAGRRAGMLWG